MPAGDAYSHLRMPSGNGLPADEPVKNCSYVGSGFSRIGEIRLKADATGNFLPALTLSRCERCDASQSVRSARP